MKRIILLITMLLAYPMLKAQDVTPSYEVQLIPENPDVASLGKFGNLPVNAYNGTANVSVPIHQVDLDGLSLPITLQYNTSGVRVNQDAGWVGLGWNLSLGMTITREINGYEDIRNLDNPNDEAESVGWIFSTDYYEPNPPFDVMGFAPAELTELQNAYNGNNPIDTEPDLFTVSLPSGSVKFYLPKIVGAQTVLTAKVIDGKNYEITYDVTTKTFTVLDPNGFTYDFDVKEYSTGFSSWDAAPGTLDRQVALQGIPNWSTSQTRMMISSWKPSLVTSPMGETLAFTYEDGFFFSYPSYSESYNLYNGTAANNDPVTQNITSVQSVSASLNAFHVKYLEEIAGDFGAVRFTTSGRDDLFAKEDLERLANNNWAPAITPSAYNAKKLDQIQVVDLYNETVKTADLHYGYFDDHKINDVDKVSYLRLKLDSLTMFDQRYAFGYIYPNDLPRKDSNSLDFWGFYNGKNNVQMIPSGNRFFIRRKAATADVTFEQFFKWNGADRGSDVNYGKYGVLEKITYPTGGYTKIDYTAHSTTLEVPTYAPKSYQDNGKMEFTNLDNSTDYHFQYQYLKAADDPTYSFVNNNDCQVSAEPIVVSNQFSVTDTDFCNEQTYNVKIAAQLSCSVGCGSGTLPTGKAVWLEKVVNGAETVIFQYDNHFDANTSSVYLESYMTLTPGTYVLKQQSWIQHNPLVVASASASGTVWEEIPPSTDLMLEEFEVGGPRVQSVINYDQNEAFISGKRYSYDEVKPNNSVLSSGRLMDDLVFASKLYSIYEYTPEESNQQSAVLHSSNRLRTSLSASGSHIGYSMVTEEQIDALGNNLGKKVNRFVNEANDYWMRHIGVTQVNTGSGTQGNLAGYEVAYGDVYILGALPITQAHINGRQLSEAIYNSADALLMSTSNVYSERTIDVQPFRFSKYGIQMHFGNDMPDNYPISEVDFTVLDQNTVTELVLDSTYRYNGQAAMVTGNAYFYGSDEHLNLTKSQTTDSDGDLLTSLFFYPQDLAGEVSADALIGENRMNTMLERASYVGSTANPLDEELSTEETVYSELHSNAGHLLPSHIITTEGAGSPAYQRVTYQRYDDYGNLVQYRSNDNGVVTTILWAHNGMYPVARVDNATFAEVATALGVAESTLMGLNDQNLQVIDNIRTTLPDKVIFTYKVLPLVGFTKTTDPNGLTTEYIYDAENRLYQIKDQDGNTLRQFEYNYGSNN